MIESGKSEEMERLIKREQEMKSKPNTLDDNNSCQARWDNIRPFLSSDDV